MQKKLKLLILFLLMSIVLTACSNGGVTGDDSALNHTGDSNNVIVSKEGSGEVILEEEDQITTKLIAQAATDYEFSHWEGDLSSTNNPEYIDNTDRREVTAVFSEENTNNENTDENGVFKLINSWGSDWGAFNDGSYYITYEAAIANNLDLYLIEPRDDYQPEVLALFELEADSREDVEIIFNSEGESKKLYPDDAPYDYDGSLSSTAIKQKGGSSDFVENNISLDISSLLPLGGELTLEIINSGSSDIYLKNWKVEEYTSYPGSLANSYDSNISSEKIEAGKSRTFTMDNISIESSVSAQALSSSQLDSFVRDFTEADWRSRREKNISDQISNQGQFGTGLKELSAQEMKTALESGVIKTIDSAALADNESKVAGEASLDHSAANYFPPVGSQGTEGSCASWSTVYYMLGFYQARDKNWDLSAETISGVDQSQLMSPDFIYQLINAGLDDGSYYTDNLMMIANLGASSWEEMPSDDSEYLSWGSEDAWRSAAANRADYPIYYIQINNYTDINAVKDLLEQGYLLSTAIDSTEYNSSGIWTADNYSNPVLDHANTVVGYDDSYQSSVDEISIR